MASPVNSTNLHSIKLWSPTPGLWLVCQEPGCTAGGEWLVRKRSPTCTYSCSLHHWHHRLSPAPIRVAVASLFWVRIPLQNVLGKEPGWVLHMRIQLLMIWGGREADPDCSSSWKNCLPPNGFLVSKGLGTAAIKHLMVSINLTKTLSAYKGKANTFQNFSWIYAFIPKPKILQENKYTWQYPSQQYMQNNF